MADRYNFIDTAASSMEWRSVLERLREDREALVDEFVREFADSAPYASDLVAEEDLRTTSMATVDYLIAHLDGDDGSIDERLPERLGARRARQGVPQEQLLAALRLNYRIIWRALSRAAADLSIEILVENVEFLLLAIEQFASEVQQSFLREEASMHHDSRVRKERALARLFSARIHPAGVVETIARALQLPVDAEFELLFVPAVDAEMLRTVLKGDSPVAPFIYESSEGSCAFRMKRSERTWEDLRIDLPSGYLAPVRGLGAIPAAAASASVLATHAGAADMAPTRITDAWPHIAEARLRSVHEGFADDLRASLRTLNPVDLRQIVSTMSCFAETGSVKAVAERMFCHRNTVLKRMRIFAELTGIDVAVPREFAFAIVALAPLEKELNVRSRNDELT